MTNELSNMLRTVGYLVIGLGVIAAIVVLTKLSEGTMFSPGGLNAAAVIGAVLVAFYHFMFGVMCIGVSTLLERKTTGMAAVSNANTPINCAKCGKEHPSNYSGNFCEEWGSNLGSASVLPPASPVLRQWRSILPPASPGEWRCVMCGGDNPNFRLDCAHCHEART